MTEKNEWRPVLLSEELDAKAWRGKPVARKLNSVSIVLFRDSAKIARAMLDYCPHRLMPLSAGKVCGGELQCAYHGWKFAGSGVCTAVPGLQLPAQSKPIAPVVRCAEKEGLVWVCLEGDASIESTIQFSPTEGAIDLFFMQSHIRSSLDQAAENFLDGFHTHFVHSGWIRTSASRQKIRAKVRRIRDGIEARYEGEGKQSGVISRLFESDRAWSAGRFRNPGLAEIEYRSEAGLSVLVSAWLVPEDAEHIRVLARVATPRRRAPAWFKKLILKKLFRVILEQDKRVVEQQQRNRDKFGGVAFLDCQLDLLGPPIRQLLNGEELAESVEREIEVEL